MPQPDSYRPDKPSADHDAMMPHWQLVRDILGGTPAMRRAGEKYLPKLPRETREDYDYRLETSKFTGIYREIVEDLAAKPFAKELALADETPDEIKTLAEDIDTAGNNLHVFASRLFFNALNDAVAWILVDYPPTPRGLTRAQEARLNPRPYWVEIPAPEVLAVEFAMVNGSRQVVLARLAEHETVTEDGEERTVERVRVLRREKKRGGGYGPPEWELWEKQRGTRSAQPEWAVVGFGTLSLPVIPLVPVITGRRTGTNRYQPPLADVAQLQIEHYQRESALKHTTTMTAFPMLSASGIAAPENGGPITVGPSSVLYAPPNGDGSAGKWSFIEPAATSLEFLAKDADRIEKQMRDLGRQPLTSETGNLTVVSTMFAASRANSVAEAWALNLKDALEQALKFTAMWLNLDAEPEVVVGTDFDAGLLGETGMEALLTLRHQNGLSLRTVWAELRRRNILSPEFDAEAEEDRIIEEIPGDDFGDLEAATN